MKGDSGAVNRLLTDRWRNDSAEAAVDPHHDGHMFSFYYRSRLDIALPGGGRSDCEDMRPGCPGMVTNDGEPADYSYAKIDTTPDGAGRPGIPQGTGIYRTG